MQKTDEENNIFKTAADFINNSNHPVFLTGKAGTGKTTFLKYIKENTKKNTAIVAPTGVAAINAGGTTIHSFFQLPFAPYIPVNKQHFAPQNSLADKHSLLANMRLSGERREVMELLELLIIDEISMVRCDVLDAIDAVLRHVRRRHSIPFGGIQVLYIGDMYQLPPVIKDEEWKLLSPCYSNQYFFSSHVITEQPPVYIELKKVYRQRDTAFINLLNQVRNNTMDIEAYNLLHSRYQSGFNQESTDNFITLTTHNNKADMINVAALAKLKEKTCSFKAIITGTFSDNAFPADETLHLKVGAQVMFLKNDMEKIRRYYNGKIGSVQKIEDDKIWVECKQADGLQVIEVKKETWRNIKYSVNNKTQQVEEEELGSFTQYPLRLAWAITIHKSQGLTFQNAIIDAGQAFAPGQVYVALSRCTSLDGIILRSKISQTSLHSDERIVDFAAKQASDIMQEQILWTATKQYQQDIILKIFDFKNVENQIKDFRSWINESETWSAAVKEWIGRIQTQVNIYTAYSRKFEPVLIEFFSLDILPCNNDVFQQRFKKAAGWFFNELQKTKDELLKSPAITDNRQLAKDYTAKLQKIFELLCFQMHFLDSGTADFSLQGYDNQKITFKKELFSVNAYSGKSGYVSHDIPHPELYRLLKEKRNEISDKKNLAIYLVCNTQSLQEMVQYLPCSLDQLSRIKGFGNIKVKKYGDEFIDVVKKYCEEHNLDSDSIIAMEKKIKHKKILTDTPQTKKISYDFFKKGKSISEIAHERNFAVSTIEGHLTHFIENGKLDINDLVDKKIQELILAEINASENKSFSSIKERLPSVTFGQLRWMVASEKFNHENVTG